MQPTLGLSIGRRCVTGRGLCRAHAGSCSRARQRARRLVAEEVLQPAPSLLHAHERQAQVDRRRRAPVSNVALVTERDEHLVTVHACDRRPRLASAPASASAPSSTST